MIQMMINSNYENLPWYTLVQRPVGNAEEDIPTDLVGSSFFLPDSY